ncbi:hypothetical protein J3458_021996 [Metarhizium acridum]|uniref:uncharacterized protein n=1 Tax=Metarhizium acridum TaxID=92637 RepID=UPI001C6C652A|nr:hypothetical protein J3458_021996 [Metarhizium acridum]
MPPRLNIPPVTRTILIVLLSQSFLSAAIRYRQWTENSHIVIPYLTLVPQLSLVFPWTFLSSALVESNVFTLAISGLTLYHGGRYLERAWSSADLAKFLVLVTLVPNILTFLVMVLFFTLTRNESWTLTTISGGISIQIAFLVAFSQLIPAHTVTLFRGIVSLKVPRFPAPLHRHRDSPIPDASALESSPVAGHIWLPRELDIPPVLQKGVSRPGLVAARVSARRRQRNICVRRVLPGACQALCRRRVGPGFRCPRRHAPMHALFARRHVRAGRSRPAERHPWYGSRRG